MNTDFNGPPLVSGAVVGYRQFAVDKLGRLHGLAHKVVWTPGDNEAICNLPVYSTHEDAPTNYNGRKVAHRIKGAPHNLETCSCGFYAYYDIDVMEHKHPWILGAIAGFGVTLLGDAGFRASKAKLLGLVFSYPENVDANRGNARKPRKRTGINSVFDEVEMTKPRPEDPDNLRRVRANYPDVPVFEEVEDLASAFPATSPDMPTPTNDPSFWERPVY